MSSFPTPTLNPQNQLNETFNANYFNHSYAYATLADLLNYGNLHNSNNWSSVNTFASIDATTLIATDITFTNTINGFITVDAFKNIQYIPNIMMDVSNITYDDTLDITTIASTTKMDQTNITNNLNVGTNINVDTIVNTTLTNQSINTNTIKCNHITINNNPFYDIGCIVYVNNLPMPIIKTVLISAFNIKTISTMYISVKCGFRIDFIDKDSNILFSYTNDTDNYSYYVQIPYNINMQTINAYDKNNILIL
jgi:hypothetical protein